MVRLTCAVALGLLLAPAQALADSDGYYCTGRGYLAFETRFSADSVGHLLHVIRFSRAEGLLRLPPIQLPDFQVHAMHCRADIVDVQAGRTNYSVDVSRSDRQVIRSRTVAPEQGVSALTANLGHWSRPGVIDLEAAGGPGEFQLVIARVSRAVSGGVEHFTSSVLVHRGLPPAPPRIRQSMMLHFGSFLETVD